MLTTRCTAPASIEVFEVERPTPAADEIVLAVRNCGICGSDLHFYSGSFPPPGVCPGHEISGEIAAVGSAVRGWRAGDRVAVEPLVVCRQCTFCRSGNYQLCRSLQVLGNMRDGGFAEYVAIPAAAAFALPQSLDFELGALAEPLAVAVHGLRLGNLQLGDRVLVQGAGTIGLMAAAAARQAGAEVWITARHPQQAAAAQRLGAARVFTGVAADDALAEAAHEQPIDVVVETIGGRAETLAQAVQVVRRGGTVVVLGIFTTSPMLNAILLVVREVRLVGSMTYGRTMARADFDVALDLLAQQPEPFRSLITHRVALPEIAAGFALAADKRSGAIKVTVAAG